jgi:hypothetical protein
MERLIDSDSTATQLRKRVNLMNPEDEDVFSQTSVESDESLQVLVKSFTIE